MRFKVLLFFFYCEKQTLFLHKQFTSLFCCCLVTKSCWTPMTPKTVNHQVPLSVKFSRQECWSGLPFPTLGESSWPRDQTCFFYAVGRVFTIEPPRKSHVPIFLVKKKRLLKSNSTEFFQITQIKRSIKAILNGYPSPEEMFTDVFKWHIYSFQIPKKALWTKKYPYLSRICLWLRHNVWWNF